MAQNRENLFHPPSPRSSSGGADSFKGTPDTHLTTFSPDEGSAKSTRLLRGASRSASATPVKYSMDSFQAGASSLDKDPFITPGRGKGLSPTALTFQPFTPTSQVAPRSDAESISLTLSADLGISRLLHLVYPPSATVSEVEKWLTELDQQGILVGSERHSQTILGQIYIHFDDIRDACRVHSSPHLRRGDWVLDFISSASIAEDVYQRLSLEESWHGQVLALAVLAPGPPKDIYRVTDVIQRVLQRHGTLFAFTRLSSFPDGTFRVLVEYCSAATAVSAVRATDAAQLTEGLQLTLLLPDVHSTSPQELAHAVQDMSLEKSWADVDHKRRVSSRPPQSTNMHLSALTMYPLMFQSPYGPSMSYMVDSLPNAGQTSPMAPMSPGYPVLGPLYQTPPSPALTSHNHQSPSRSVSSYARSEARRQNAARINRSPHHNATGHHNHVDIQRIREGIDVRTTIMLRNIPNKVDQVMLKRIVDESSWGKYDFMYLRIDFANDCNVGYAFINFVDPLDIIDFVDARGNQRWNCFKSDKVAEISYATIQGKDCLVQKFRNSSVMLEAPHYRPKLYFTSNGPMPELAGQEEPFPDPDNQSKMKRSCENAEHVGLFTPNAGQHFRDEQRRRRSQYDRGTRLAALEEYDYESTFHQLYGPGAQ